MLGWIKEAGAETTTDATIIATHRMWMPLTDVGERFFDQDIVEVHVLFLAMQIYFVNMLPSPSTSLIVIA